MSLINKMLQDLDARGGSAAGAATQANIMLVVREQRQRAPLMLAGGALLLLTLAAGGYFGWRVLQRQRPAAPVPLVQVKTVLLAPRAREPVAAAAIELAPVAAAVQSAPPPEHYTRGRVRVSALTPRVRPKKIEAARSPNIAVPAARNLTNEQRAESDYRRALTTLQEGRTGDAIGWLELALQIDPRHEAACQTLVGLLIEIKRPDEAMRQLQLTLGTDPRQPAMAMLLARLQIERGGSGVDTLLRTLPAAAGNADYHAFLAGALQRQQRHREAVEQYQVALRANPRSGVWLMGLGISLQAEKRNAEALGAFTKASSLASLSPELQAFVDHKLIQLSP